MQIDIREIPVFYINLDKDIEKRKKLEKSLKANGFINIIRLPGFEASVRKNGCAAAHHNAMKCLANYPGPFLVLEDDAALMPNFSPIINVPENADAVYLGVSASGLYNNVGKNKIDAKRHDENFYRIYNMLAAHAILYLNSDYVKFLEKEILKQVIAKDRQDKARARTLRLWNVYSLDVPAFFQDSYNRLATTAPISEHKGVVGHE